MWWNIVGRLYTVFLSVLLFSTVHETNKRTYVYYSLWSGLRRHVIGQSDVNVIRSCWGICSLCFLNLLGLMLICYYSCSLLYLKRLFCFTCQIYFSLHHDGVYFLTVDTEFSDVSYIRKCDTTIFRLGNTSSIGPDLWLVIAIPEIPICGFPEIPFSPKSRNSGIFQAKIPEIRDFHFLHYLL